MQIKEEHILAYCSCKASRKDHEHARMRAAVVPAIYLSARWPELPSIINALSPCVFLYIMAYKQI